MDDVMRLADRQMLHTPTGETALVRVTQWGVAYAQFDRFDHPHSHGWHVYPAYDFAPITINIGEEK